MNKTSKIILGVLTALPLLLHLWALTGFLGLFAGIATNPSLRPGELSETMTEIVLPAALGGVIHLGVFAFYVWRILSRPPKESNSSALWILGMLFLSPVMLYYWLVEVWPDDAPATGRERRYRSDFG